MPKSPGLDSFCGFKAGEMRKDRKIGDTEQVTTKPRTKFRKFDGVGLRYSKGGRLCEISTWESISASNGSAAAKKEFEECVKWFRKFDLHEHPGLRVEGWSDDNGGNWQGIGGVNTQEAHLNVEVTVSANKRYRAKGKSDSEEELVWLVSIFISWNDVDNVCLVPGVTSRRTNPRIPLKTFVEQTFRTSFKSVCPAESYNKLMAHAKRAGIPVENDAQLAYNLAREEDLHISGTSAKPGIECRPYIDVISPRNPNYPTYVSLPGVRFAYGKYLAKPVCYAQKVMFAYSNPKDTQNGKAPVNGCEDLSLSAIVLWGKVDHVKDGKREMTYFVNGVKSWFGIEFSETNANEHVTTSTFREGDLTITAKAFVEDGNIKYYIVVCEMPVSPQ